MFGCELLTLLRNWAIGVPPVLQRATDRSHAAVWNLAIKLAVNDARSTLVLALLHLLADEFAGSIVDDSGPAAGLAKDPVPALLHAVQVLVACALVDAERVHRILWCDTERGGDRP